MTQPTPITLTIAGSDSGGGAGIQADIKAISATGSYACSVITATTAQNTLGVMDVHPIPVAHVAAQLDAVFSDLEVRAVKIGMLADANIIKVVADKLRYYRPSFVVLDPVMVATSGDLLLQQEAIQTMRSELFPLVDLITPNLPEAATLLNRETPLTEAEALTMVDELKRFPAAILLKGGHLVTEQESKDWLIRETQVQVFSSPRIATKNTHGTGCTLSAAIASFLAQGLALEDAIARAKGYLSQAIAYADTLQIGKGHGPVHHFYKLF
ncbi:bifunctional hydroxymethylpyrimidine kinase/phosphomethylpyrimidine kinase [Marinomonas fungiae]|nr:bifunctional hydroxymethylpyrimidine kinase/phosphomethylpyrimidine kinase [Marinomonas fungiae]